MAHLIKAFDKEPDQKIFCKGCQTDVKKGEIIFGELIGNKLKAIHLRCAIANAPKFGVSKRDLEILTSRYEKYKGMGFN